ncbi:cytochrome c oxidase polypeptide II [Rickettsia typhi str. TH1527]|uniref:Cytochrome c oxidase polypeptide II n=1 Tax=Rickettsia typhi str. TH1527 TaxID=1003201 RepID=A0ABM5MUB4_RICTP|nr:cytochrome c oxidase polypeptide II [Rickettsia typhi str. TH1527]
MDELYHIHDFLLYIIRKAIILFVAGLLCVVCIRYNATNNPVPEKFSHNLLIQNNLNCYTYNYLNYYNTIF